MSSARIKTLTKELLGRLPGAAGIYQRNLTPGQQPPHGYLLPELSESLPSWVRTASEVTSLEGLERPKKIFVFGYLRWWLEYSVTLSLLLRRLGHEVSFGYLPYRRWTEPVQVFDADRQSEYIKNTLAPLAEMVRVFDLSDALRGIDRPDQVSAAEDQAQIDVQYTLQREVIDLQSDRDTKALYDLRLERNARIGHTFAALVNKYRWDTVVLPNGSILEFGMLYRVARSMGLRTVTFEFGEQRERIWLAVNDEVMLQDTSELWQRRGEESLTEGEAEAVTELYEARMSGRPLGSFTRLWQSSEVKGGAAIREELALAVDAKTVLLCTNVVGDSLALKRQVFTRGMADWLAESVKAISRKNNVDLIVRVHPGELLGAGHPSLDIVHESIPDLPAHVRLIAPESEVNTYDLIEVADVGLVYTTTVGMEMAMHGLPVLVAGQTHYRGKGFTLDPTNLEEFLSLLDQVLERPGAYKLTQSQIDKAWHYAYLFFFEYPKRFPWHLVDFWRDLQARPFDQVVQSGMLQNYLPALAALTGSSIGFGQARDG